MDTSVTIRQYDPGDPGDSAAMYDICWRTGPTSDDGSLVFRHQRLLGEIYLGPYIALEPELAFVAEDADGVAGYVIGARDTAEFEAACEESWWPKKRVEYPETAFQADAEERLVGLIHQPRITPARLTEQYPSHLHIDLLPRLQGRGSGRQLMNRLFTALRRAGSPGVHLGVGAGNRNAIGFYVHLGMRVISQTDTALVMAAELAADDDAG